MGFPPFLLSVREYRPRRGQVEGENNTAGTTLNSAKPIKL